MGKFTKTQKSQQLVGDQERERGRADETPREHTATRGAADTRSPAGRRSQLALGQPMQAAGRGQAPDDRSRRAGWRPVGDGGSRWATRGRGPWRSAGGRTGGRIGLASTQRSRVATGFGEEEAEQTNSSRTGRPDERSRVRPGPCLLPIFFFKIRIVALSFIFDKYCPIIS